MSCSATCPWTQRSMKRLINTICWSICNCCRYLQPGTACSTWRKRSGRSRRIACNRETKASLSTLSCTWIICGKHKKPSHLVVNRSWLLSDTSTQHGTPVFQIYGGGKFVLHSGAVNPRCDVEGWQQLRRNRHSSPSLLPWWLPVFNNSAVLSGPCPQQQPLILTHTHTVLSYALHTYYVCTHWRIRGFVVYNKI